MKVDIVIFKNSPARGPNLGGRKREERQWSMSRELPKEDFPAVWESRSQGLGIPAFHYHLLSLFLGEHLLHMSIPRVLSLQTASFPLSRALSSVNGNPSD